MFHLIISILLFSGISCSAYSVEENINSASGWENIFAYNKSSVIPLVYYGDKSYFFGIHMVASYMQATEFCNNIHMKLLTIRNEEENDQLFKFIRNLNKPKPFWTSGSRLLDGRNWIWMSYGDGIDYTKWAPNQPDGDDEQCLQVVPVQGKLYWNNRGCSFAHNFICERYEPNYFNQLTNTQVSRWDDLMSKSSVSANIGLLHFGNKKYFFSKLVKASYILAIQFCKTINMQLVSISSQEENDRLSKYIRDTHSGTRWWSSGTKLLDGKNWIWLTKGKSVEYTNWLSGQPDKDDELCLMLVHDNNVGLKWADEYCSTSSNIICESLEDDDYDRSYSPSPGNYGTSPSTVVYSKGTDNTIDQTWEDTLEQISPDQFIYRYHGGNKYLLGGNTRDTQSRAARFCEYHGMQLVEINDSAESADLEWLLLDTGTSGPYWLAAKKSQGEWFWPQSQRPLTFENWAGSKPSRSSTKNCLLVDEKAKWFEEHCDTTGYFVCEVSMNKKKGSRVEWSSSEGSSCGKCPDPIVNVYVNTNLVTDDGKKSLTETAQSSKDFNLAGNNYQVLINNNIDTKPTNNSVTNYYSNRPDGFGDIDGFGGL